MGSSQRDLRKCPDEVRDTVGYAIYQAELGEKHPSAKPLKGYRGAGVLEVVEDHDGNTYRAVYTVKFHRMLYVLHVFQKKSVKGAKTPIHEIDLINARLKMATAHYKTWTAANPETDHGKDEK